MILWERNSPVTTARQSSAFPLAARHDFGCYVSLLGESKYVGHNWNWFLTGAPIRNNWIFQNSCRKRGGNRSIVTSDWARGGAGRCRSCSKKKLSPKPFFHHFEHFWKKFKKKIPNPKEAKFFQKTKKNFFSPKLFKNANKKFPAILTGKRLSDRFRGEPLRPGTQNLTLWKFCKIIFASFWTTIEKTSKKKFFFRPKPKGGTKEKKNSGDTNFFFVKLSH